jgi:ribosomal protein S1
LMNDFIISFRNNGNFVNFFFNIDFFGHFGEISHTKQNVDYSCLQVRLKLINIKGGNA